MPDDNSLNISLSAYEQLFQKYRSVAISTEEHFKLWKGNTPEGSIEEYINHCFKEAAMYIAKYAPDKIIAQEWKLELDTKLWEFHREQQSSDADYYLQQIHVDRLLISKYTLPFEFDIVINSKECCSCCSKHHSKQVTLESILKGSRLPYKNCKREDYCICTYDVIPKKHISG